MSKASADEIDIVKRPNSKSEYQDNDILDLMRCVDDPFYFIEKFVKVQHPMLGTLPLVLFPFQVDMVRAFHEHRLTVALTARQMGKALALTTPIPTPSGWTTMGDIRVGDHVLGDDGRAVEVTFATDAMFGHRCYEVEFDNGEVITADAEHLWTLNGSYFRDRDPRTLTTEQIIPLLLKAKQQGQSLYVTAADALDLPEVKLPIEPYTLGVWLGDGNSADSRFCGHKDDCEEMRGHVMADGYTLSAIKADPRNDVRYQSIYGLRPILREAGILGRKRIPDVYLRASKEQRLDLLRGLLDTDGYAAPTGGCEFYQKDRVLAEQVFELVASLGMKPRLKSKIVNGETYWKVRFATVKHEVFKLDRKQAVANLTKGHPKNGRHFFKSIRQVESVPVRCIEVANDSHLFLAGRSMVPTHNTTTAAAYLLWKAMFTPDCTILICANKLNQAIEIMDRVRYAYENLPDHIRAGVTEYNKGTVKFDNGSKITARATTPDAGRGLSISLLYLDEFAFVQPRMAKEFFTAIQPVLSTGGGCIITSTPKSDEDEFGQIYRQACDNKDQHGNLDNPKGVGKNKYFAITVPWYEHPERDEAWAEGFRASLGPERFAQEFECRFFNNDESLISPQTLSYLRGKTPFFYQHTNAARWYSELQANRSYMVALDPSLGTGGDYAAIQVFQLPEMVQVAEWQANRTNPRGQVKMLLELLTFIHGVLDDHPDQRGEPEIFWTVENNSIGEAILTIIEDTGEERFPGLFVSERKRKGQSRRFRKGMTTTNQRKLSACARFKSLMESGRMTVHSANLIKELKGFVSNGASFAAKPGDHDDLVSAVLLVIRMLDIALLWGAEGADLKEHIHDDELFSGEAMPVVV